MGRLNKKIAYGLLAGALAAVCVAALDQTGLATRWDNPLADWRARLLAKPSAATEQVKLILLTVLTLAAAVMILGFLAVNTGARVIDELSEKLPIILHDFL